MFKSVINQLGGKVRILYFGAAAMNKHAIDGYNMFGIASVQGYGLTETSPLIAAETDKQKRPGSVGRNPYNVQIKLIDEDGNEITNTDIIDTDFENIETRVGEIVAKGPNIMLGYYENEEETNAVLVYDENGVKWYNTKDVAVKHENGEYEFVGTN